MAHIPDDLPRIVEQLHKNGVDPADPDPAQFSAFIAKEITLWGDAVKIAGVTLQ